MPEWIVALLQKMPWLASTLESLPLLALGAGGWQLYLHLRSRTFQKRLAIDITASNRTVGDKRSLFIDVKLENTGRVKLEAFKSSPSTFVYQDQHECLRHSCSLRLKRINMSKLGSQATHLDWYRSEALEAVDGIPTEINLLDDYILPKNGNVTTFWLEPTDIVHLSAAFILPVGLYIAKVCFYGRDIESDYWSSEMDVHIV
jgi:hypothetical protein